MMNLKLKIWRQNDQNAKGKMVEYNIEDIDVDMSFLEMLDVLNQKLIIGGEDPIAFDHDCREGICGACSLVINGSLLLNISTASILESAFGLGSRGKG